MDARPTHLESLEPLSHLHNLMGIVITFEALRYGVAPHFTTVVPNANGLRDYAGAASRLRANT